MSGPTPALPIDPNAGLVLKCFEARNFTITLRYAGVARHSDRQQMECFVTWSMAHEPLATVSVSLSAWEAEQDCNLCLDRLRQCARVIAQHPVSGSAKSPWLGELENVIVSHGVSLLWWRNLGSNSPTYAVLPPHAVSGFRP